MFCSETHTFLVVIVFSLCKYDSGTIFSVVTYTVVGGTARFTTPAIINRRDYSLRISNASQCVSHLCLYIPSDCIQRRGFAFLPERIRTITEANTDLSDCRCVWPLWRTEQTKATVPNHYCLSTMHHCLWTTYAWVCIAELLDWTILIRIAPANGRRWSKFAVSFL